jgi:hypothetical protein
MNNSKSMRLLLALSLLFSATAHAQQGKPDKAKVNDIQLPAPPAGKGQIVFFRGSGSGAIVGCSINENSQKVSSLGDGRYFVMVADPGRHEFSVKSEAKDVLPLEVEADETQFVECRIKMGILIGRPDLAPASEEIFRKKRKLKMVDADDMGPGVGALRPEEVQVAIAGSNSR